MKEEYTAISKGTVWTISCIGGLAAFIIPPIVAVALDSPAGKSLAFLSFFALLITTFLLSNMAQKASFDADDTQVTFSYFGKDTVIRYDKIIKDLKLERHNDEYNTKTGIQRYYVETLRIITSKGRIYHFSARMDIDYEKVARNPASMTTQFENSKFSRLKMYIEEHRK
jgi:hypothetical protein